MSTFGLFGTSSASSFSSPSHGSSSPSSFSSPSQSAFGSRGFCYGNPPASSTGTSPSWSTYSTVITPVNVITPVKEDAENDLKKRVSFLSGFLVALKERTHTDIQLKPNNGPCIAAHKALLAARSEIFKNMLGSDSCKAPPSDADTITLSELNTEELESLLEFLYTGNLPSDKMEKHVYALYVAADKYEILYLQESCERYMLNSLNTSNAIDVLGISDSHSNKKLKEGTLNFIIRNMKDIVSSKKYEDFASSNPHLCVQITRAFVDAKI